MTQQLLGLMGPIGAAMGIAQQMAEAVATVDEALKVLEDASTRLKAAGMTEFDVSDFGASWAGSNLGGHGTKAQSNVLQQLDQLSAGLQQYREDLVLSAKEMEETDATEADQYNALTACVAPDFTTDSGRDLDQQCAAPGVDG